MDVESDLSHVKLGVFYVCVHQFDFFMYRQNLIFAFCNISFKNKSDLDLIYKCLCNFGGQLFFRILIAWLVIYSVKFFKKASFFGRKMEFNFLRIRNFSRKQKAYSKLSNSKNGMHQTFK